MKFIEIINELKEKVSNFENINLMLISTYK